MCLFGSAEALDIFSPRKDFDGAWGHLLENPDDLFVCEPETRTDVFSVPVVTDVPVSPSSVMTEFYEDVSLDSDWEC